MLEFQCILFIPLFLLFLYLFSIYCGPETVDVLPVLSLSIHKYVYFKNMKLLKNK